MKTLLFSVLLIISSCSKGRIDVKIHPKEDKVAVNNDGNSVSIDTEHSNGDSYSEDSSSEQTQEDNLEDSVSQDVDNLEEESGDSVIDENSESSEETNNQEDSNESGSESDNEVLIELSHRCDSRKFSLVERIFKLYEKVLCHRSNKYNNLLCERMAKVKANLVKACLND